jgi:hypothetical protein
MHGCVARGVATRDRQREEQSEASRVHTPIIADVASDPGFGSGDLG